LGALQIGDAIQAKRSLAVQNQVESAVIVVAAYAQKATDGEMSIPAAQAAIGAIRDGDIQTKVADINDATQGQSHSIAEASKAVSGLRSNTKHNAASLEESSAGSHQLQAEAEKLLAEVAKLNGKQAAPAAAA